MLSARNVVAAVALAVLAVAPGLATVKPSGPTPGRCNMMPPPGPKSRPVMLEVVNMKPYPIKLMTNRIRGPMVTVGYVRPNSSRMMQTYQKDSWAVMGGKGDRCLRSFTVERASGMKSVQIGGHKNPSRPPVRPPFK
mmetsp:Transcript_57825/g.142332  ORF Transcript_57825/g.142332 Transcript_57825/m.142332 type:complete len:137 (-) Transcript_57825:89-499(-)